MNFDLLRSWLGLPPGPWPPDHYSLLGFPGGHADVAAFEPRVLQQMDRLRTHQLLHPELVTEGMNRLAQALITLTDPAEKAAYDSERDLAPILPSPRQPTPVRAALPPPRPEVLIVAEPVLDDELPEAEPIPDPHPTEVTQEFELPDEPLYEVIPDPPRPILELHDPLPAPKPLPVAEELPAVRPWPTPAWTRRWIYTRLALIRRGRRAWQKLRPVFLDPLDPLDRPGRILILLEGAGAVRPLLPTLAGVAGGIGEPGGLVAAVVKQPLLLDTIRRLLPGQRKALALDWRNGLQAMDREYARMRMVAVSERAKAEGIARTPAVIRWLKTVPELILIGFGLLVLFIAVLRSLLSRGGTSP